MSRQARIFGEYLHVIIRGIGKQILFEDDADRRFFLSSLKKYGKETEIKYLAYCLMNNHVHLLIQDANHNIALLMKKINVCYAQYYNTKYERTGHLFQNRYKSEVIDNYPYLMNVYRYILNNPANAGLCSASAYPWSSYHDFGKNDRLTDTNIIKQIMGNDTDIATFLSQESESEITEPEEYRHTDAWAISVIRETLNIKSGTELQQLDKKQRNAALSILSSKGISIRQLERLTGITRGVIQNI